MKLQDQALDHCIWFLDYDGSLCPHCEVWESSDYDTQEIFDALEHLHKAGSELLWNTGRRVESLASVDEKLLQYSGYFVQGCVYWDSKTQQKTEFGPTLPQNIVQAYDNIFKSDKKYRIEHKPTSLRLAPLNLQDLELLREKLHKNPVPLSDGSQTWEWHVGHRGAELLPVHFNKGTAISKHMDTLKKPKVPIVIGDDTLDATAAIEALKRGGYFLAVGSGCGWITEVKHQSDQLLYFDTPKDALNFIHRL